MKGFGEGKRKGWIVMRRKEKGDEGLGEGTRMRWIGWLKEEQEMDDGRWAEDEVVGLSKGKKRGWRVW